MKAPPMTASRSKRAARGDVMLITLVFLMVFLLGLVVAMRGSIVTTLMVGNNLTQQKDVQVSDVALRQVEAAMVTTAAGQPIEFTAGPGGPAWWRDVPAGTLPPDGPYFATCSTTNAGNSLQRCGVFPVSLGATAIPYTALAVVQSTGRADDSTCNVQPNTHATYYDIYLRVSESSGATSTTTETVYRLCTRALPTT